MTSAEYGDIPIDAIDDPKRPLRTTIEEDSLDELMHSMSLHGLLHPIRISPSDRRYRLVFGHRRLEAARRLHWSTIPSIVTPENESTLREVQLHENIHRTDLKPTEEAAVIQELYESQHWTLSRIATATGRSIPWVEERIEMSEWPNGLSELVDTKQISIGVARVLMRIPDDNALKYMARQAAESGATVRQAQAWYQSYMSKPWQLPTPEEIAEAKRSLEPPPVPMAICGGCNLQTQITNLATWLLCPTCQMLIPQLKRGD